MQQERKEEGEEAGEDGGKEERGEEEMRNRKRERGGRRSRGGKGGEEGGAEGAVLEVSPSPQTETQSGCAQAGRYKRAELLRADRGICAHVSVATAARSCD